jgi:hypothetical protein
VPLGLPYVTGPSVGVESRNGRSHGRKQVEDEARESPVRFLEYRLPEGVAEALRSHSRRSQKMSELYSPPILKLVSPLVSPASRPRAPHVLVVSGAALIL